jgi:hypothetical protein
MRRQTRSDSTAHSGQTGDEPEGAAKALPQRQQAIRSQDSGNAPPPSRNEHAEISSLRVHPGSSPTSTGIPRKEARDLPKGTPNHTPILPPVEEGSSP